MTIYEVTGRARFRGYPHGTRFEAQLHPQLERRAIERGAIRIAEESTPSLRPGSYELPAGWVIPTRKRGGA